LGPEGVAGLLRGTIERLTGRAVPTSLLDWERIAVFDRVEDENLRALLSDFYHNRSIPYRYDFSVMSKHALSRIYERYVSLLHFRGPGAQLQFFPEVPEERTSKATGAVYTPEFIARFFARFLQENLPPSVFKRGSFADLACGSGIFLRTVLESQIQSLGDVREPGLVSQATANLFGVDIDENACAATRLSLAVLHLVATGRLPEQLSIECAEAVSLMETRPTLARSLDGFIVNPPFVRLEAQSPEQRQAIAQYLEGIASGRIDSYMPFLKIGIDTLKAGRFGLFVLPQSFLFSSGASGLRLWLVERAWIRCLVDLSSIRVFQKLGAYVVLLVIERKGEEQTIAVEPEATVIRCRANAGMALQDYLDDKVTSNKTYSIFRAPQEEFKGSEWAPSTPEERSLERKLIDLPKLGDVCKIGQGVITGADDIYVIPAGEVPVGEAGVYRPFLPDKQMRIFRTPRETGWRVFYPFDGARKLTRRELALEYPSTWRRLERNRTKLKDRAPVRAGSIEWWELIRPRNPSQILGPKIVTPHISLVPRFSLDTTGRWLVSRAPYIGVGRSGGVEALRIMVLVLNSSLAGWFLNRHSRKYGSGYNQLEVGTLRSFPIPAELASNEQVRRSLLAIHEELAGRKAEYGFEDVRSRVDLLVSELYELDDQEIRLVSGL
jgi:type I restriction-modification system DNA methylase subunit